MEHASHGQCPSEADLTAYYDLQHQGKASPLLDALRAHVESCPLCHRKLQSYALMDRLLADVLAAPPDLSQRIKRECHRVAEDDRSFEEPAYMKPLIPWWSRALRHAAVVAVGLGAMCGVWYGLRDRSAETSSAAVAQAEPAGGRYMDSSRELSPLVVSPPVLLDGTEQVSPTSGLKRQELMPVGLEGRFASRRQAAVHPRALGDAVRHVWMVDDLAASRKVLSDVKGVTVSFAGEKNGRLIAHLDGLDDRTLQGVVEGLEKRNWALVSPMLPQPGQSSRVSFNGHPVSYTVWIVEKGR